MDKKKRRLLDQKEKETVWNKKKSLLNSIRKEYINHKKSRINKS
ncbi:putative Hantavirus glycoprotein G2 [Prochlorococcus marinus str. SS51]|nr:putative Hantavirus glycoprotein G2 [Prochlorococcus marinus str. SS35]KGG32058.1 putative Hantavirus glycoprotein G2 [Prochlorococcus marinus str. SS51]